MKKFEYVYAIWILLLPLMGILQTLDFAVDLINELWTLWFWISAVIAFPTFALYMWIKEGCNKGILLPAVAGVLITSSIILRVGGVV
jgi:phosphoglycerol transferase MdoB-like AlkP superfamily enzyme